MKSLTIQLPDELAKQVEAEAVERKMSTSDVIRYRLTHARSHNPRRALFDAIIDVISPAERLPYADAEPLPPAERMPRAERLSEAQLSPDVEPLALAKPVPPAEPLPEVEPLPDDQGTRKKKRRKSKGTASAR